MEDPELTESKRRRFRTKRMRPDFFNPLDMEYSTRRRVSPKRNLLFELLFYYNYEMLFT